MSNDDDLGSVPCCPGLPAWLSWKLFKALSDPKRLSLLMRLTEARQACTVGVIAEGSGIDISVVSRHLAILREAGIIRCEKRGKEVWCVVETAEIVRILRTMADALEACCPNGYPLPKAASKATLPKARRAR